MNPTADQIFEACLKIAGGKRGADRLFFAYEAGCADTIAQVNAAI